MDEIDQTHAQFLQSRTKGVLVTLRRDGRPQLSNVLYAYDPQTRQARVSVTADRAKTRNAERDPRVSLHATSDDFWSYVVADGRTELSAVAQDPDDDAASALADLYRDLAGEHPDWAEFRQVQVAEQRRVLTLHVERTYGSVAGG